MQYHYGKTIKEYRIAKKMTLAQLASKWPSKEIGVNIRYVQDVEAGKKQIVSMETLRKLASLLDIPLWKFGLSDYDPFNEKNTSLHTFIDMNSLLELIESIWYIRLNMPSDITEKKITSLSNTFNNLIKDNSRVLKNNDFLVLYAQVKRLQEVVYTEKHNYAMSLKCSFDMLNLAKQSGDIVSECLAMTRIGVELLRNEDHNALDYLEKARDLSFSTSSKEVAAYCYSFLARGYATFGDEKRFLQAVNTAIALADNMKGLPVVTKDYVFHAFSAVLEEKSNGLILLGRGKDALNGLSAIDLEAVKEGNTYLKMWMPLDYAQSFMLMNEIETSVKWLEKFYASIKDFKSARLHSTVERHLSRLEKSGYVNLPAVKSFKDMYYEEVNNNSSSE
ncbi:MAG TPA: helix-turn-helix transcriptional regulator [Ktedonosporobacter sp.]|nr:helix-turn-helix transcriptional regulator [Ktedonosporobacter sp.]